MRKTLNLLISVLVVFAVLSGCQAVFRSEPEPAATFTAVVSASSGLSFSTETPIAPTIETPILPQPTGTVPTRPQPTLTPALIPIRSLISKLDCGEIFCQVNWPGILDRPISPAYQDRIEVAYPYGSTRNGTLDPHHGVEFYNSAGTPVLAAAAGEVVFAGTDELTVLGPYTGFYGNVVILRHNDLPGLALGPVYTLYAHLSTIDVAPGQYVEAGNRIGLVGSTGAADGAHLHFEVRVGENDYAHTTNPLLWFAPKSGFDGVDEAMLAGLILDRWGEPLSQFAFSLDLLSGEDSDSGKYYPETYYPVGLNSFPNLDENFVRADLPSGDYRVALVAGKLYAFEVSLEPGSLTFFKIQLD